MDHAIIKTETKRKGMDTDDLPGGMMALWSGVDIDDHASSGIGIVLSSGLASETWCASSVIIAITGLGMIMGHTSCLMSALQAHDSPIKTNIHSASWLASAVGPSMYVGTISTCVLMDVLGRRRANLLVTLPGILGWIMTYLAQNYTILLIGRILAAVTAGGVHTIGIVVIGEYTSPQNRGIFLSAKTTAVAIGSTISHLAGYYMDWRTVSIIALIPHIIAFIIACTCPESPTWLATRKQFDKCELEFFWLRGMDDSTVKEAREIIKAQKNIQSYPTKNMCTFGTIQEKFRKFISKNFLKPFFTLTISAFVMEASGRHYFPAFALQIMDGALNVKMSPYYYTLCVDLIIIVACSFSTVLIRIIKRRTLLFNTGLASIILLVFMCIYIYLISNNVVSNDHPWIITFIFILYYFLINLGCIPIPFTLQAELFPIAHRESGSAVLGAVLSLLLMCTLKITPFILAATKVHGTLAINGGIMAVSLIILYFILPETKDRTLQEIEDYYQNGKFTDNEEKDEVELKMISDA